MEDKYKEFGKEISISEEQEYINLDLKVNIKKQNKMDKYYRKYFNNEKFEIARTARKTIKYIEKNVMNIPNNYKVLRDRTINCCYNILENVYRANIFQDINVKKEICVNIQMLNFYLNQILNYELITYKKFESYSKHLFELDIMVRSWFKYEKLQ